MYTQLLSLPKTAPQGAFHAPVFGPRRASHSQAGVFLRQAYGKPTTAYRLLQASMGTTQAKDIITLSEKRAQTFHNGHCLDLVFEPYALIVFPDYSTLLGKQNPQGTLDVFPAVFCLRSDLTHLDTGTVVHTMPAPKHGLYIAGDQRAVDAYQRDLHTLIHHWAHTLKNWSVCDLRVINTSPMTRGELPLPAFAPLPAPNTEKLEKAKALLVAALYQLTENDPKPMGLLVRGTCLDKQKPPRVTLSSEHTQDKRHAICQWLRAFIKHQNFPLQHEDWLVQADLPISKTSNYDILIRIHVDGRPKSAHQALENCALLQGVISTPLQRPCLT